MEFVSSLYFWIIAVTVATRQLGQVHGESQLNFVFAEPPQPHQSETIADQSVSESNNGPKARINRSPRILESVYNWSQRRNPPRNAYSHHRYNSPPSRDTHDRHHPTNYYKHQQQEPSYKAIDEPITNGKRDEPDFWPSPMQHHVQHSANELPKMFYLKTNYHQDRRPSPYGSTGIDQESTSWRQSSRFIEDPAPGITRAASFHRNQDGTYRLPGPRPQSPRFRHLVTQTSEQRPVDRPPNVQVHYDYPNRQRPFRREQIETDLSSAIANFVQQHFAETKSGNNAPSHWSNNEPFESDIEVYVRFVDRRRRKA